MTGYGSNEWNEDGSWNYNWPYVDRSHLCRVELSELGKLKQQLADMTDDCERMTCALTDMEEARDAVSAASKFLRDKCDMQSAVLKMIAVYGTANPNWAVRVAKAMVESE